MEWAPLQLSLEVSIIATLINVALGVPIAALLALKRFPGRELVDALVTAPMVLPPTVLGYYLLASLGIHSGIGRMYESLTGSTIVFTYTGCVVAAAVGSLPLVVKGARAAIEDVDQTLVQAARTLGAGPLRAIVTVVIPLAARGIIAGLTLGFAKALGDFGITLMIGGDIPGETQTASLFIYDMVQAGDDVRASGMAAVLTAVAIVLLYVVNRFTGRRRGD